MKAKKYQIPSSLNFQQLSTCGVKLKEPYLVKKFGLIIADDFFRATFEFGVWLEDIIGDNVKGEFGEKLFSLMLTQDKLPLELPDLKYEENDC